LGLHALAWHWREFTYYQIDFGFLIQLGYLVPGGTSLEPMESSVEILLRS